MSSPHESVAGHIVAMGSPGKRLPGAVNDVGAAVGASVGSSVGIPDGALDELGKKLSEGTDDG